MIWRDPVLTIQLPSKRMSLCQFLKVKMQKNTLRPQSSSKGNPKNVILIY